VRNNSACNAYPWLYAGGALGADFSAIATLIL